MELRGHIGTVISCIWSDCGQWILSSGNDDTVRMWSVATGRYVATRQSHFPVSLVKRGKTTVGISLDKIRCIRWKDKEIKWASKFADDSEASLYETAVQDHFGKRIAIEREGNYISLWWLSTASYITQLKFGESINGLDWSPDGQHIAVTTNSSLEIWTLKHGKRSPKKLASGFEFNKVIWSPDGKKIATTDCTRCIRIWNAISGKQLQALVNPPSNAPRCIAWSSDSRWIVSGDYDNMVRIWDAESDQFVELSGHSGEISDVAWSSCGQRIVSASSDQTLRIWTIVKKEDAIGVIRKIGENYLVNENQVTEQQDFQALFNHAVESGEWYALNDWCVEHQLF